MAEFIPLAIIIAAIGILMWRVNALILIGQQIQQILDNQADIIQRDKSAAEKISEILAEQSNE